MLTEYGVFVICVAGICLLMTSHSSTMIHFGHSVAFRKCKSCSRFAPVFVS